MLAALDQVNYNDSKLVQTYTYNEISGPQKLWNTNFLRMTQQGDIINFMDF